MCNEYPYSRYPEIAYDELYESYLTPVLDYAADIVDGHIPYPFVDPEDRELGLIPTYGSFESYD